MNPLNIVFFVNNLDSGGIENYLLRFLKEKHKFFGSIYIYCKSGKGGQLEEEYLKFSNITIIKKKLGYFDFNGYRELKEFLILNNISVICDFMGNFSGLSLRTAYKAKVNKRVAFYRGSTDRFKKGILRNSYNNLSKYLVKRYSTDILSNSKAALNYFFPKYWEDNIKFDVVSNGINAATFLSENKNLRKEFGIPDSAFVVGHTGRYNEAKNHTVIISVAEKLVSDYDDIYFILCGNGVKDNLSYELDIKGLTDKILLFENRTDISEFLNTMDCYFFPSLTEGQPNALIEAMIVGLPYVASNIDPIKETVFDLENLHDPNDIDSFYESLKAMYHKKPQKQLEIQRKAIEKFDFNKCFNHFYTRLSE
ncbi:glycosyltransferase [Psychrobacter sp. GP33]|uniref:glycosyltransferase n=1 Tax=Psychrobacter sp. GP33 TaxID=2758709 RepID=UPI0015F8CA0B|nr:glycosyltransferase [Psychrobacter sp. GP33]